MRRRPHLVFFLAPALAYLTVLLVVALFVARPSALGWIGFGVAALVALLVAGAASALYPRSRANAPRLHPHPDGAFRLLVVADSHCDGTQLCRAVQQVLPGRPAQVLVLAPALPSPLHFLTDTEGAERDDAEDRLDEALQELDRFGIPARGMVGSDDPLQAIGDALARFPANEVLLAAPERGRRSWLEQDLESKARDAYGVHVAAVAIATAETQG